MKTVIVHLTISFCLTLLGTYIFDIWNVGYKVVGLVGIEGGLSNKTRKSDEFLCN